MGELVPYTYGFNHASMIWLDHLRNTDPEYRRQIIEHWEKIDAIITDVIKEGGVLDRYAAEQENSRRDDYAKWGQPRITDSEAHKFEEETENVRAWLAERQQRQVLPLCDGWHIP